VPPRVLALTALSSAGARKLALSIVTISKDDPEGLRATIESVLAQSFGEFELVLVRSGLSQSLALPDDPRLVTQDEPARGISAAFNSGLARASGEWVQFLNGGDVFVAPTALGDLIGATAAGAEMVLSFAKVQGRDHTIPRKALRPGRDCYHYASHQASLFRRELFERYGGYSTQTKIRMDLEWLTRLPPDIRYVFVNRQTVCFDANGVSSHLVVRSSLEEARILWRTPSMRWRAIEVLLLRLPFRTLRRLRRRWA
jgi:glycosyltransferase involved in cell wall biosynthesis